VTVLDALTYAGHRENLEGLACELVVGDIRDGAKVRALLEQIRPDGLVHFAAESHVDRSIEGPAAFLETNVMGTFELLRASREYLERHQPPAWKYVQVSTDEVYGSLGETGKFSEETPFAPNSPYSASKASADHFVRAWHHTFGFPAVVTHCSNNYGPRQYPEKLIPHMIRCALEGKALPVYGDGQNVRDWIHVDDHCTGVYLALTVGRPGETYCFGGNAEKKNLDLVHILCDHLDRLKPRSDGKSYRTQIAFVKDRLGHDRRYAIDDRKAERELQFTRKHRFESGLEQTIRWYLENERWSQTVLAKGAKK
jgi:dTDP-glucose 4,6-dehydratase